MSFLLLLNRSRFIWPVAVAISVLFLVGDIWTKALVHAYFKHGWVAVSDIEVWRHVLGIDFAITYAENTGAAWGVLGEWQWWLLVFRIVAVVGLLLYLRFGSVDLACAVPWSLVAAGAVGNIIDTFLYGHVIDFLLFTFWGHEFAVFNIADCGISIGVMWLVVYGVTK